MKIILFDINEQLCEGWRKEFEGVEAVMVSHGPLEDIPAVDCLVAAGNSYGIMDGGLDRAMAVQFPDVVKNVADAISEQYLGEIPVGNCVVVQTEDDTIPYLAYTPTMRFPRQIAAEAVYDSMRATLLEIRKFNEDKLLDQIEEGNDFEEVEAPIFSLAIPGFGTRTGGVGAFKAARMMRLAYDTILGEGTHQAYEKWDDVEPHLKSLYKAADR